MPISISEIHMTQGDAWVQGESMRGFADTRHLLETLGCKVEEAETKVFTQGTTTVPLAMFNVEFPEGSKHIKRPKEVDYRRSLRSRRQAENKKFSLQRRKGQILIPGDESDFVVTYYKQEGESPKYFDRGAHEVEKDG
jgi:hypothetical protein